MTIEQVSKELDQIRKVSRDDERAHTIEDALHVAVLEAIAEGADNARDLAREALKSVDIDFCRWCA